MGELTHPSPLPGGELGGEEERAQAAATAVGFADRIAEFLNYFGRWRERDALLARLTDLHVTSDKGLTQAEYLMLNQRGEVLWHQGRAAQAQQVFRDLLTRLEAGAAYDAAYDHAYTLWNMGRCLAAQGRPAQAIEYHRRALQEFEDLSESIQSAKEMMGKVYGELGDFLRNLGQFDEAQQVYENALKILKEVDDHRAVGVTLGQLGTLALSRGDLQEAARRYTDALKTFRAFGEPQMEAVAWHQLGGVAQEAKEWDEAERCCRESLKLSESQNNLPYMAQTCNQLANVANRAGRLDDAERWYLRTIEIDEKLGNPKELALDYNNLAGLYLSQKRFDEAELYARRAVEIKETLDLSAAPWTTYKILARIAGARGRAAEATQWRRKAQDNYAAYAGSSLSVQKWEQQITVIAAACQGDTSAQELAEQIVERYKDSEDSGNLVTVFRRILDGERDIEALRVDLDCIDFVIVRVLLAQLAGEAPSYAAGSASPKTEEEQAKEEEGMSLQDFLALIVQACRPDAPPSLAEQLHASTRAMSADPNAPAELRALFSVLNQILSGERAPDLAALPPELADLVRGILGVL